jgi:hypothetical protein
MELDPHTLQQIIARIEQQMRCPQCGKRVPIDFTSVRVAADDFMLLQLKCDVCDAYIVLHAALKGSENLGVQPEEEGNLLNNASSSLHLKEAEVEQLREALKRSGGSFEELFKKYGSQSQDLISDTPRDIDIA